MTSSFTMQDGRLIARIISLMHRFGCGYSRIDVRAGPDGYDTTIDFTGSPETLGKLDAQIHKLLSDDKETFE
jgi:hypothetical protein